MSTTSTNTAGRHAIERAAARAAKEVPLLSVRPGWWVYSYGSRGGSWAVVATVPHTHTDAGAVTRLALRDSRTGASAAIEQSSNYPTSCLTPARARALGLTGGAS